MKPAQKLKGGRTDLGNERPRLHTLRVRSLKKIFDSSSVKRGSGGRSAPALRLGCVTEARGVTALNRQTFLFQFLPTISPNICHKGVKNIFLNT